MHVDAGADYGADVIKIELPGSGDDTRTWGPPFIGEESAYFLSINRNKRSLTLNFREPKAVEVFLKLAGEADVVVENFTPGVMARLGIDYETVKAINPRIVFCSISGFGADRPLQGPPRIRPDNAGHQRPDEHYRRPGRRAGENRHRRHRHRRRYVGRILRPGRPAPPPRDRRGQYIDIAMLDAQIAWLTYQAAFYFANNTPPQRLGKAHPTLVPYQGFMAQDGKYFNVAVGSERLWDRFCQGIGRQDLKDDPEYATNGDRVRNRAKIVPMLQEFFLTRTSTEWVADLQAVSVPAGPINDLADVFADPQVIHREMLLEMPHPTLGSIKQTGLPLKFSVTPGGLDRHPPLLGEHNREILAGLGLLRCRHCRNGGRGGHLACDAALRLGGPGTR